MRTKKLTISFMIHPYVAKDEKNRLFVRLIEGRENMFAHNTGIRVFQKFWDSTSSKVTDKHPQYKQVNLGIVEWRKRILEIQSKYDSKQNYRFEDALNELTGRADAKSLDNYVESHYKSTFDKTKYNDTKNCLRFFKLALNIKKPLLFTDITLPLIKKYQRIQEKKVKAQEISSVTAKKYVSGVKSICNEAYTEGAISEEIKIPKKYTKFKKVYTGENNSNTKTEISSAIDNCHTMQRWESVATWLLMFGMRGIYQADIPVIGEGILMEDSGSDKLMPFKKVTANKRSNWTNATLWLDHRRRKKGDMPMFIKLNRSLMLLIEKLKYSYMYTHADYKIGGKYIVSDVNDRVSIVKYDIAEYPKKHHSLWRNRGKLLKQIHPELVRFKDARKTFFQLAEQIDNTLTAKQLCGQTVDSLASNFYSNYKNKGIVEKIDKLHDKVLREFNFNGLVTKLIKKYHELVDTTQAPKWLLKQSAVIQEGKEWRVFVGFVNHKPQFQTIDKKYKRFLNDNSIKEDYWADLQEEDNTMPRVEQRLAKFYSKMKEAKKKEIEQLEVGAKKEELQIKLDEAVQKEDYEECAVIRDKIAELV